MKNILMFSKILALTLLILLFITTPLMARHKNWTPVTDNDKGDPAANAYKIHVVGKIWSATSNFGNYGDPNSSMPSCDWPGGLGNYYLWEGRFWIGAIVDGEKLCTHADYGNYEWAPTENTLFYFGPGKSIQDSKVTFDDVHSRAGHTPLYLQIEQRGLSWSMPDYDEFIAYEYEIKNVHEGRELKDMYIGWNYDADVAGLDPTDPHLDDLTDFDGEDGSDTNTDELDVVENIWTMDLNGDNEDGYDEYGWPYGWELNPFRDDSKTKSDGFYDEYTVILDEDGEVLHYQVNFINGDISGAADDIAMANDDTLKGWLFPRDMSYIYDADSPASSEDDTGERGITNPSCDGFIFGRILYADKTQRADNTSTTWDDSRRLFAHQWWNWESDPGDDIEKYNYLTASHIASGDYHFLPNPKSEGAPVFDYRFLHSIGPYKLSAGESIKIVWVQGVDQGLKGARWASDQAMLAYYTGSETGNPLNPTAWDAETHWLLPAPPPIPVLQYAPGDKGQQIILTWDNTAEFTPDIMDGLIDFVGYKIYRSKYSTGNWEMVYACDNIDVNVNLYDTDGNVIAENINLPNITHKYEDTGQTTPWGTSVERPINGLPYYYTIVAYDTGRPNSEPPLPAQESAKSNYRTDAAGAPIAVYPGAGESSYRTLEDEAGEPIVRVVPNPYKGTSDLEAQYEDIIMFINLPEVCKISIYSLTGDLVQELYHKGGTVERWDLISRNHQTVVSGLYYYIVERDDTEYEKIIGKLVIIR